MTIHPFLIALPWIMLGLFFIGTLFITYGADKDIKALRAENDLLRKFSDILKTD